MKSRSTASVVVRTSTLGLAAVLSGANPAAAAPPAAPAPTAVAAPIEARPVFTRTAEKGFVDDPMAISPDGKWLAVIATDSASFVRVEFLDLATGKVDGIFPLGDPQQIFDRVEFTGNGRELLLLVRDPLTAKRSVQRFGADGKPSGLIGPATEIGFSARGDKRYVLLWNRSEDKKGNTLFTLAAHDLGDWKPVGKPKIVQMGKDGLVAKPPLRIKGWVDGFSQIIGQEPGGFDKTRDMRMPDRAAVFDLLRGEVVTRVDIKDVMGWALANGLRARALGRASFLLVPPDQQDLEIVDGMGGRAPVGLGEPFEMYDLRSLQETEDQRSGVLHFGLTIDPLNPAALERKKADKSRLDIYRLAIPSPGALAGGARVNATLLLRAAKDKRPVGFTVGGGHVIVLRKFKAFNRGGNVVEGYKL